MLRASGAHLRNGRIVGSKVAKQPADNRNEAKTSETKRPIRSVPETQLSQRSGGSNGRGERRRVQGSRGKSSRKSYSPLQVRLPAAPNIDAEENQEMARSWCLLAVSGGRIRCHREVAQAEIKVDQRPGAAANRCGETKAIVSVGFNLLG